MTDDHLLKMPLRSGGKLTTQAVIRLAYGFACGVPVSAVAKANAITQKTVRAFFLDCRDRLKGSAYRRWHRLSVINPALPDDASIQALLKVALFDVMAECHDNTTCHRNYRLGNRKSRFCRSCPLSGRFKSRTAQVDAIRTVAAVQDFYRLLGLRREADADAVANFRDRLLHMAVVMSIRAHTARRADGSLDPGDVAFEALGSFLTILLDDLAAPAQPETEDWLLDDGSIVTLPKGRTPS